jgi:two-component system LytT family sensor kinase
MIPFLENSFKFSRIEETQDSKVDIKLLNDANSLIFSVENTFNKDNIPASGSGMGIKNVQDRLQLIYPGKHQLDIKKDTGFFSVSLKIRMS